MAFFSATIHLVISSKLFLILFALVLGHHGPLLLEMLHEGAQGLHVDAIDQGARGDDVSSDEAPRIQKHHHHLFSSAGGHQCP
jgi:hypothetical protein